MAHFPIHTYGDSCLREIAAPIDKITPELRQLIAEMVETMYQSNGIGLAATQIGKSIRLFVTDVEWAKEKEDKPKRNPKVWINPEITWESAEDADSTEGCLSVPGIEGEVFRPQSIKMRYRDENWTERERLLEGLEARCAQHELDHINGILFIDRIAPAKRQLLAGKLSMLKHVHAEIKK
jgi:peptide deformylase